jgi:3-hydroxypropanoate dehydrogenase
MLAARALGLDCGPMGGFKAEGINQEFFPNGQYKVNFLCNIGYGDSEGMFPRGPRLDFDEACEII